MVAEAALKHQLDPRLVAATVAVESGCDPYATSTKGAIGLMQVRASTWKDTYDFQQKVNLLNPQENLETGTDILAGYIKKYGKVGGVTQYQGLGTGCPTCDGNYTSKILKLAEEK
jgi:soluble lytic murein transglycosylase-like protein